MVGIPKFSNALGSNRVRPDDPFSHGAYLIDPEKTRVEDFQHLMQKDIMLANLSDDANIRMYQNDALLLTGLFSQLKKEPQLREVFDNLYQGWIMELGITRAKDNGERILQAAVHQYKPQQDPGGYGADYQEQRMDDINSDEGLIRKAKEFISKRTRG